MKKFRKILGWTVGILLLLVIVLVIALELFFPVEKAKAIIIEEGTAALGRPIGVEGVDVSIWGGLGVELQTVTVANPPDWPDTTELLRADKIDVKLQLLPLISGEYRLDRLIINKPVIHLRKMLDGSDNFTFAYADTMEQIKDMPSEAQSAAAAVSFDRLAINGGLLTYVDDSSGMSARLDGFNLRTSLTTPREQAYHSAGHLEIGKLTVVTDDTIPSVALELDYQADYDMAASRLLLNEGELRINDLGFVLSGELNHADALTGRGRIRSNEISVRDLFSMLPEKQLALLEGYTIEGDFSLDADVEFDGALEEPLSFGGSAVISDLRVAYSEISGELKVKRALADFRTDNVRLNIEEGTFDGKPLRGQVLVENFDSPVVTGNVSGEIDLALVRPFLPAETNPDIGGNAAFSIKISGPIEDYMNLEVSGDMKVSEGRYSSSQLPEPIESFDLDVYFDNRTVRVNAFDATMPSGTFSFSGRVNDLLPYMMADSTQPPPVNPIVDGTIKGNLNLAMLNPLLPPEGNPEVGGMMSLDLTLAGDILEPSGLRIRGSMNIDGASYADTMLAEPIERLDARLTVVPDTIRIDQLTAQFRTSDLSLTGSLIQPFPYLLPLESIDRDRMEKPFLVFRVSSQRFNVDSLFPETSPTTAGDGEGGIAVRSDTIPPIVLPRIDGRGTAAFDTVVYMDVEFTNLTADVRIRDRVITATNVTGDVYTGDLAGEITVDLSDFQNPVYKGTYQATQIEADDFAGRFTRFGGLIHGKFNFEGDYNAVGWEPDSLLNSLTMQSDLLMREGRIVTDGPVYKGLSALAQLAGETIDKEHLLKNAQTKVTVQDGRVQFDELTTVLGKIGDLSLNGSYGFDGSLNYTGSIKLSEAMTKKVLENKGLLGKVGGLLGDGSVDRLTLPVALGGTIDNPSFNLDTKAITEQAGKNLLDQAGDKLKGLNPFKKDDG